MRRAKGFQPRVLWPGCNVSDADCLGGRLCCNHCLPSWWHNCGYPGEWLAGVVLIFIMAPIGYGQHVALGMAIDYAEGVS